MEWTLLHFTPSIAIPLKMHDGIKQWSKILLNRHQNLITLYLYHAQTIPTKFDRNRLLTFSATTNRQSNKQTTKTETHSSLGVKIFRTSSTHMHRRKVSTGKLSV